MPATQFAGARAVAPSLNKTLPVGVPEAAVTVAVNVTICPKSDGFADDATVVVVAAAVTVSVFEPVLAARKSSAAKLAETPLL